MEGETAPTLPGHPHHRCGPGLPPSLGSSQQSSSSSSDLGRSGGGSGGSGPLCSLQKAPSWRMLTLTLASVSSRRLLVKEPVLSEVTPGVRHGGPAHAPPLPPSPPSPSPSRGIAVSAGAGAPMFVPDSNPSTSYQPSNRVRSLWKPGTHLGDLHLLGTLE